MTEEKKTDDQVTFESLDQVLNYSDEIAKTGDEAIEKYKTLVFQLTGHRQGQPIGPLDVVRIVKKAFKL